MDTSIMVRKCIIFAFAFALAIGVAVIVYWSHSAKYRHALVQDNVRVCYSCPDVDRTVRYHPPLRKPISIAESNEVAKVFASLLAAYTNGQCVALKTSLDMVPDVVTNMPDQDFAVAVHPLRSALKDSFMFAEKLREFDSLPDFDEYMRINLYLIRFLGDAYVRRGGECGLLYVYDSQTLGQLMRYRDMFHERGLLECEHAAEMYIAEWKDQIESENGFTRRYMWFQVDLQWPLYSERRMTLDGLSRYVKSYAAGLIRLGYTPKWLSEFDDLSKAVK